MAIIVILQVKVLSPPSKKELKNVTSISYSVVESPQVTRGKKKRFRKPRKNRRRFIILMCQIVKQGLVNIQVGGPMNYMNRDLTSTWL